ncbi:MAG: aminotransferase class I/II-fold pyridoxal phosphate-dependent enzyme [Bacillota bacterium]
MNWTRQRRTPIFDAVQEYINSGIIPFHVPGHKQGRGLPELRDYVGDRILAMDLTCLPDLDNICNPLGVIREAEDLTAEAFGADHAYFLVNGTTSGIQAMIMSVCQPGDKIILPRNAHKSALGGLILSGATPVYIEPQLNRDFGISMGVTPDQVEAALNRHPEAKAVFVVNPNYYGTAPDIRRIVEIAHRRGVPVIVDEAHGAHFSFHPDLPVSAMKAGADMSASSAHKLLGSMTQSSFLLLREGLVSSGRVKSVLNLTQTTSPSYILLCSLDVARKQIATQGKELLEQTLQLTRQIREELRYLEGITLLGEETIGHPGCFALDPTKITINVQGLGLSGYEMEKILRRNYRIQVELSDLYNLIVLITIADTQETAACLLAAFQDIVNQRPLKNVIKYCPPLPDIPEPTLSPRGAFNSDTHSIPLVDAEGEISAEAIMAYPPGIPLLCPGETITRSVIEYINVLKQEEADLQGTEDPDINSIKVVKRDLALVQAKEDMEEVG